MDDNSLLTEKLQKKFKARALSLESAIEKINKYMEEERHYEISRIAKKNATLKGKITSAIEEFKTLMSSFVTNQAIHFKNLLDSISRLFDLMAQKFFQLVCFSFVYFVWYLTCIGFDTHLNKIPSFADP